MLHHICNTVSIHTRGLWPNKILFIHNCQIVLVYAIYGKKFCIDGKNGAPMLQERHTRGRTTSNISQSAVDRLIDFFFSNQYMITISFHHQKPYSLYLSLRNEG